MGNIKFFTFVLLLSIWGGKSSIAVNNPNGGGAQDANAIISCTASPIAGNTTTTCGITDANASFYSQILTASPPVPGRPNPPTTEFYTDFSDPYQRAVCGTNGNASAYDSTASYRIPVLASFEPLKISTNAQPLSGLTAAASPAPISGYYQSVRGSTSTSDPFTYLYNSMSRCVCMGTPNSVPSTLPSYAQGLSDQNSNFSTGNIVTSSSSTSFNRIYPDTFDVINSQDQSASVKYNMVAIAQSSTVDGRLGSVFKITGASGSFCGCPNINEIPELNGTSSEVPNIVGVHCQPNVSGDPNDPNAVFDSYGVSTKGRILTTYNANIHANQIIAGSVEGVGNVSVVDKILLPTSAGGTQIYNRKIWTCAPPYTLSSGVCVAPTAADHKCGTDGIFTSPVSSGSISDLLNKKLACCMNQITSGLSDSRLKFDCVDNSQNVGTNFNGLWSGHDVSGDGDQPYALVLAGVGGKYLTGFYTLDGVRCEEYKEFGEDIPTAKLKMVAGVWSTPSPQPTTVIPKAYSILFTSSSLPSSPSDKRRCPILVRAAMVATCPENPDLPVVQKTFIENGIKHCTHASSIQVHVRVEQVYEIDGLAPMKPVDTVAEQRSVSSISVERIITNKISDSSNGGCPPGSSKQGDVCVYQ